MIIPQNGPGFSLIMHADHARWEKTQALGLRVDDFLARNDSYHFLQQTGDLIMTGPTGTNVMDMTALLIS